jgi:chloramphenicol 3-O phosphotransferase
MAASVGVIVDEVVLEPDLARDWVEALGEIDAFVVAVHCNLVELERREVARGDRLIGQARGQFDIVHTLLHADFAVDTTATDPATAADAIVAAWCAHTARGPLRMRPEAT